MKPDLLAVFMQEKGAELKAALEYEGHTDQQKLAKCAVIGLKWVVETALKELTK